MIEIEQGNIADVATLLNDKGELYSEKNEFETAIGFFLNSLEFAREINSPLIIKDNYSGLEEAYAGIKDFENAYKYCKLYNSISDSLDSLNAGLFEEEDFSLPKNFYYKNTQSPEKSNIFAIYKVFFWIFFTTTVFFSFLYLKERRKSPKN